MATTGLERIGPAYLAYSALDRLPRNAPTFELDGNGYPIVQRGERYCRAPTLVDGVLCGKVLSSRPNLIHHLEVIHEFLRKHRPHVATKMTQQEFRDGRDVYEQLMEFEEYDRGMPMSNGGMTRTVEEKKDEQKQRKRQKKLETTWVAASKTENNVNLDSDDEEVTKRPRHSPSKTTSVTALNVGGDLEDDAMYAHIEDGNGLVKQESEFASDIPSNVDVAEVSAGGDDTDTQSMKAEADTGVASIGAMVENQTTREGPTTADVDIDLETLEREVAKNEYALKVAKLEREEATLKRKECEAEIKLLESKEKLAARKKSRLG